MKMTVCTTLGYAPTIHRYAHDIAPEPGVQSEQIYTGKRLDGTFASKVGSYILYRQFHFDFIVNRHLS